MKKPAGNFVCFLGCIISISIFFCEFFLWSASQKKFSKKKKIEIEIIQPKKQTKFPATFVIVD
jgi:hypothetical protein